MDYRPRHAEAAADYNGVLRLIRDNIRDAGGCLLGQASNLVIHPSTLLVLKIAFPRKTDCCSFCTRRV